jgi:tetratricopeptide (TPR) repeat protein
VLFFFDPQSPPCLMEMNFLDTLLTRARDFGLAVFAIESKGRAPADVNQAMERYCAIYRDPSFAMVPDPAFRLGAEFGVRQAPTTFLVGAGGAIALLQEGFDKLAAVELTRAVERALEHKPGGFSFALRNLGVTEEGEAALMTQLAARDAAAERQRLEGQQEPAAAKALTTGDRTPAFDFVDLAGRSGRWDWPAPNAPARLLLLWSGLSVPDVQALAFLDGVYGAARDAGLEALAIEAGGLDTPGVHALLDRYRKFYPPLGFPVVADEGARFERLFGKVERSPRIYLVGSDGVVALSVSGFSDSQAEALTKEIERLLRAAGRYFAPLRDTARALQAPIAIEEAPSIQQRRERKDAVDLNLKQGDYAFFNGDWAKALPFYLRVFELDPRQVSVLVRVAQIYERLDDTAKARETWQRVIALQPDNAEARQRLKKLGG